MDNDVGSGGSSTDNNEIQNTASTTPETTDNTPQWLASMEFPFPMEPYGCFDNSYTSLPFPSFPSLENLQELVQVPMEPNLVITPMMHNEL